jgi:two-component system response regulator YesN
MIYEALKNDETASSRGYSNDIDKVLVYLNKNFRNEVSLETASKICNMNKSYFSRYFKKVTGIGFSRYLTTLRIKEASLLLKNTNMSIGEIAEKSGFESQQHFCYIFKKETGISAGEYRKRM